MPTITPQVANTQEQDIVFERWLKNYAATLMEDISLRYEAYTSNDPSMSVHRKNTADVSRAARAGKFSPGVFTSYAYNDLRLGRYPQETDAATVTAFAARSTPEISADGKEGSWYYREAHQGTSAVDVQERISLNATGSVELLRKLDQFILGQDAYYKVPNGDDKTWHGQHDPVTIYFKTPPSAGSVSQLAVLAAPHIRKSSSTVNHMIGKKIADGIFRSPEPNPQSIHELTRRATSLHPVLASMTEKATDRSAAKIRMSAGHFHVLTQAIQGYEQEQARYAAQQKMGHAIEQFCSRPLTQPESVAYGHLLQESLQEGADTNLPVSIHGRSRLPVEAITEVAANGNHGATNALKILMQDPSLRLDGARESLESLTLLQYVAKYGSRNRANAPGLAAHMLANDPRTDIANKNGGKTAAEFAGSSYIATAIDLAQRRRLTAKASAPGITSKPQNP